MTTTRNTQEEEEAPQGAYLRNQPALAETAIDDNFIMDFARQNGWSYEPTGPTNKDVQQQLC